METQNTGPCAKQVVTCTLVHPDGRRWVGRNDVNNPQTECPRGNMPSGIGYELCARVCGQNGHAEEQALRAAGVHAKGCTAYIEGIHYICSNCQVALTKAGATHMVLGPPSSATGTTGASIDTPEFRALLDEFAYRASERRAMGGDFGSADAEGEAEAALIAHIDAIIADLRAQLAAKGQDEQVDIGCLKEQSAAWYAVVNVLNEVAPGWQGCASRGMDSAAATIRNLAAPASAQPDRGADVRIVPAATSPASQPVALTPIYQVRFEQTWSWHDATEDAFHTFMPERRRIVYTAPAAVAPSDATGKADAANAGVLSSDDPKFNDLLYVFGRAFAAGTHEQLVSAGNNIVTFINDKFATQSPATSAADAKDAAGQRTSHPARASQTYAYVNSVVREEMRATKQAAPVAKDAEPAAQGLYTEAKQAAIERGVCQARDTQELCKQCRPYKTCMPTHDAMLMNRPGPAPRAVGMADPLPCPFCGGPAELKHTPGSYGYYPGKWSVGCNPCGVRTRAFDDEVYEWGKGHKNVSKEAKQSAINTWNTRAK